MMFFFNIYDSINCIKYSLEPSLLIILILKDYNANQNLKMTIFINVKRLREPSLLILHMIIIIINDITRLCSLPTIKENDPYKLNSKNNHPAHSPQSPGRE